MATELAQQRGLNKGGSRRNIGTSILGGVERGGLPLLLLIMFLFFALNATTGTAFTSGANLKNIMGNQAVTGLVALAMVVPLVAGYFDLSVAATCGVTNVAVAATIGPHQWPFIWCLLFALAIGAFIGLVNGFLVAKMGLSGFVVTLGSYTLLGGLTQLYTKGQYITAGIPRSFGQWGAETFLGVPYPFWLVLVVGLIVWYALAHTPFGRYLESIGSNESAARLVGINVTRTVWCSFVFAGILAAIAGVLETSRAGSASAETGAAFLFPAFTAVFLGATTIRPGRYNVWGTLIGVYFVAVSVSGLTLFGATTWAQPVFDGTALIIAVAISTLFGRARERRGAATGGTPAGLAHDGDESFDQTSGGRAAIPGEAAGGT
jgi:ribose transport system permease protein